MEWQIKESEQWDGQASDLAYYSLSSSIPPRLFCSCAALSYDIKSRYLPHQTSGKKGISQNSISITFLQKLLSCQHLISLKIFLDCLIHNLLRQCPVMVFVLFQPVARKLFVEGWLSMAWLISFCRPET